MGKVKEYLFLLYTGKLRGRPRTGVRGYSTLRSLWTRRRHFPVHTKLQNISPTALISSVKVLLWLSLFVMALIAAYSLSLSVPLPPPPPFPPRQAPLLITGATIWLRVIDQLNKACIQISNGVCVCGCVFGERLKRRHNRHHGQISRLFTSLPAWWGSRASINYRSGAVASVPAPRSSHALAILRLRLVSKAIQKTATPRAPDEKRPTGGKTGGKIRSRRGV